MNQDEVDVFSCHAEIADLRRKKMDNYMVIGLRRAEGSCFFFKKQIITNHQLGVSQLFHQ